MNQYSRRDPATSEYLVGVNYFAGLWRRRLPSQYVTDSDRDWRRDHPERIPLLGCFNDQATMDAEIVAAAQHGVDTFHMLWYPPAYENMEDWRVRSEHWDTDVNWNRSRFLNTGVERFLESPQNHRLWFTIEYVNHPPFTITDPDQWRATCYYWANLMRHPSYLRVGGRAVFKLHSLHHFLNDHDVETVLERLRTLREIAREMDAGPLTILAGPPQHFEDISGEMATVVEEAVDGLTHYTLVPGLTPAEEPYPYERIVDHSTQVWEEFAERGSVPYRPALSAGWNPVGTWSEEEGTHGRRFELPSRAGWQTALERVKDALDSNPSCGIPDGEGGVQKTFHTYAWNEWGEGGIVGPTVGEGWMKLEAIEEVFSGPE